MVGGTTQQGETDRAQGMTVVLPPFMPGESDIVGLGRYEAAPAGVGALRDATGRNTPAGVWLREHSARAASGRLTLGDVFDTGFEFFAGLVDGDDPAPSESYHDYDSFLFGPEWGRHPRQSLAARDES